MRIACPSCEASYDVPDALLAGRSAVRCARCGHEWRPEVAAALAGGETPPAAADASAESGELPEAPPDTVLAGDLVAPERTPRSFRPPAPPPPRAGFLVWIGWACTVAIVVLVLWGAYARRSQVMQNWPPSARLYAALGLAPSPPPAAAPAPESTPNPTRAQTPAPNPAPPAAKSP